MLAKFLITENLGLLEFVFPVGIVTWFAQHKNPNILFKGTTWKYIGENKTIRLGKQDGSDILNTGGTDNLSLSVDNLPEHAHGFQPGQIPLITGIKVPVMQEGTPINTTLFLNITMLVMMEVDTLYMGSEAKTPVIQVIIVT